MLDTRAPDLKHGDVDVLEDYDPDESTKRYLKRSSTVKIAKDLKKINNTPTRRTMELEDLDFDSV